MGLISILSGGRGALDWKSDLGLRVPRAGILAEEQTGWSSAVFDTAVETAVSAYWTLPLHWPLCESPIAVETLCNKQPNTQGLKPANLPSCGSAGCLGLAALGVARLHRSPGMGWVPGRLGGGHWGGSALRLLLGPAVSVAWLSHGSGRGPREEAGHTRCRLRPAVLSLPPHPLAREGPVASVQRPLPCAGPRGHETAAREVLAHGQRG